MCRYDPFPGNVPAKTGYSGSLFWTGGSYTATSVTVMIPGTAPDRVIAVLLFGRPAQERGSYTLFLKLRYRYRPPTTPHTRGGHTFFTEPGPGPENPAIPAPCSAGPGPYNHCRHRRDRGRGCRCGPRPALVDPETEPGALQEIRLKKHGGNPGSTGMRAPGHSSPSDFTQSFRGIAGLR